MRKADLAHRMSRPLQLWLETQQRSAEEYMMAVMNAIE